MKFSVNYKIELKKNEYPGLYIALEGIDGCGKTTQAEALASYFKKQGRMVVLTREPRKEGIIGDLVHKILLGKEKLPPASFQYLFTADRVVNHEEVVLPALKKGHVVITDRCFWSAVVYGILDKTDGTYDTKKGELLLMTQGILSWYHQFTAPDYTFYLKVPPASAFKRLQTKKDTKEIYESQEKVKKVALGYEYLKKKFPKEIIVLDGEKKVEEITNDIIKKIKNKKAKRKKI